MRQKDPEAEVRTIAAHHVASFSKNVPQDVISEQVRRLLCSFFTHQTVRPRNRLDCGQLIDCVSALAGDASQHVKGASRTGDVSAGMLRAYADSVLICAL